MCRHLPTSPYQMSTTHSSFLGESRSNVFKLFPLLGWYTTLLCTAIHLEVQIKCLLPVLPFLEHRLSYCLRSSTYKSRSDVYYLLFPSWMVHYHIMCCHPPISPDQMSITCYSLLGWYTTILCAVIYL
jgi:hypothetical protein